MKFKGRFRKGRLDSGKRDMTLGRWDVFWERRERGSGKTAVNANVTLEKFVVLMIAGGQRMYLIWSVVKVVVGLVWAISGCVGGVVLCCARLGAAVWGASWMWGWKMRCHF